MALIPYPDDQALDEQGRQAVSSFSTQHKRPALLRMMMAHYPPLLEAMDVMYAGFMKRGALDHRTKELIFVTASNARNCHYCAGGHSRFLVNEFEMTREQVCEIRSNPTAAAETPQQAAILEFAQKAAIDADAIGPTDVQRLREVGIDEPVLLEVLAVVALSAVTNTVAKALKLEHDLAEFGLADEYF